MTDTTKPPRDEKAPRGAAGTALDEDPDIATSLGGSMTGSAGGAWSPRWPWPRRLVVGPAWVTPPAHQQWPLLQSLQGWRVGWLGGDLAAAVSLAAIAIPEQMATARLIGLPLAMGFYSFIAGSIAFAVFGSNRWVSVGADSTVAPIMSAAIGTSLAAGGVAAGAGASSPGSPVALAGALALVVGLLLLLVPLLRLGWLADLLSIPVTTGFLAGIAVRIALSQLPDLLGVEAAPHESWRQIPALADEIARANPYSVMIGAGVFAVIFAAVHSKRRIPGSLIALVGASLAVPAFHLGSLGVRTVGIVAAGLPRPQLPHVAIGQMMTLVGAGTLVALVCIMQTSAVVRSFPPPGAEPRIERDIFAVGTGSIFAALLGGFAVNASPPRTALVQSSGGKSQIAHLIATALILGLLVFASSALSYVPHAALAGLLLFIATHLFRLSEMRQVARQARLEFLLLAATAVAIVALPIIQAVSLGIVLSLLHGTYLVARPAAVQLFRAPNTTIWWAPDPGAGKDQAVPDDPDTLVFAFAGPLLFTNAHYFRRRVDEVLAGRPIPKLFVLEGGGITDIDFTGAMLLRELFAALRARGTVVALARLESPSAQAAARRLGVIDALGADSVFMSVAQAVEHQTRFPGPAVAEPGNRSG